MERIVVTGMGAVTPLGLGVDALFHGLCSGTCAVGEITRFDASALAVRIAAQVPDVDLGLPGKLLRDSDAFTQYALCAAAEALTGWASSWARPWPAWPPPPPPRRA